MNELDFIKEIAQKSFIFFKKFLRNLDSIKLLILVLALTILLIIWLNITSGCRFSIENSEEFYLAFSLVSYISIHKIKVQELKIYIFLIESTIFIYRYFAIEKLNFISCSYGLFEPTTFTYDIIQFYLRFAIFCILFKIKISNFIQIILIILMLFTKAKLSQYRNLSFHEPIPHYQTYYEEKYMINPITDFIGKYNGKLEYFIDGYVYYEELDIELKRDSVWIYRDSEVQAFQYTYKNNFYNTQGNFSLLSDGKDTLNISFDDSDYIKYIYINNLLAKNETNSIRLLDKIE